MANTVKPETLASGNFDEFGESKLIRQSLTNQYTQISAYSMKMPSNSPKFISSMLLQ